MRLLVLGGTRFVGRCVVEAATDLGAQITTVNRGVTGTSGGAVDARRADRTDAGQLAAALGDDTWDFVVDTWSGAPRFVRDACGLLKERVGHYCYVSSRSVYVWPWPPGMDESAPVVAADPNSDDSADYAAAKRGGELAVLEAFGAGRCVIARAGLILGPYESVCRLPWWLRRIERGGEVLAPGPPDRPLQYVDARDLAAWLLETDGRGVFNTVSEPGQTTIGQLLDECRQVTGSAAELRWTDPSAIEDAGIEPWTQLPIWVPPEGEWVGVHDCDVGAAMRAGLSCRPAADTVADTWAWLTAEGDPAALHSGSVGLDPQVEQRVLATGLPAE